MKTTVKTVAALLCTAALILGGSCFQTGGNAAADLPSSADKFRPAAQTLSGPGADSAADSRHFPAEAAHRDAKLVGLAENSFSAGYYSPLPMTSECLSAGDQHTVGLCSDGTVVAAGCNDDGQCSVGWWTDIVAVSAGGAHTVGLRSDGTVLAVGRNTYGQCNVEGWTDIVAISAGGSHTVGLRADGTVVATGKNTNGQCNVGYWRDVKAISAGGSHTVGQCSDGTMIAIGNNTYGQCNVYGWNNIVSFSAGGAHTVGLHADGTVVASDIISASWSDVGSWTGMMAVSAGDYHTVGLRSDGTVVAVGQNLNGQCSVSDWNNIVAVFAGEYHTVGLRADGTVVAVGQNQNGQCNVGRWTDIGGNWNSYSPSAPVTEGRSNVGTQLYNIAYDSMGRIISLTERSGNSWTEWSYIYSGQGSFLYRIQNIGSVEATGGGNIPGTSVQAGKLRKTIYNCVGFTLRYSIYGVSGGNGLGTRDLYVHSLERGWEKIGQFEYPTQTYVSVSYFLSTPLSIDGFGTLRQRPEEDTHFSINQQLYDIWVADYTYVYPVA